MEATKEVSKDMYPQMLDWGVFIIVSRAKKYGDDNNIKAITTTIRDMIHQSIHGEDAYANSDIVLSDSISYPETFAYEIKRYTDEDSMGQLVYVGALSPNCDLVALHDKILDTVSFACANFSDIKDRKTDIDIVYNGQSLDLLKKKYSLKLRLIDAYAVIS